MLITVAVALAATSFNIDLARYFPTDQAEESDREIVLRRVDSFLQETSKSLTTPDRLEAWLRTYEDLSIGLQKHDLYVYVRSETDQADKAHAAADSALESAISRLDAHVERSLAQIGASTLERWLTADPNLSAYRYFATRALDRAVHEEQNRQALEQLADPTLESLKTSYKSIRRRALGGEASRGSVGGKEGFLAKWTPYLRDEDAFAAILIPLVTAQNGKSRLEGFSSAPEAAYFRADLSIQAVRAALAAIRASSDAYAEYRGVVAETASRRTGLPLSDVHTWNLDSADTWSPAATPFPEAVRAVLAAEQPMGKTYAQQYQRLFDTEAHRVEWCHATSCDDTGFSVGYAGMTSGLFYGKFDGSTNSVRALAHEAGHAVHRQFMCESQPRAVYNSGPHFLSESFAILNELLLLDHLARTAPTPAAAAYYAHKLLDDITFQVYGSARETDLEEAIYSGIQAGTIRSAADLDRLASEVFSHYEPRIEPELRVYWASNRLYFTDPLYDVNYLFAGLLALEYLHRYQEHPKAFASGYVALLKNGFTDTPETLLRSYLNIDLQDVNGLIANATNIVRERTAALKRLYQAN